MVRSRSAVQVRATAHGLFAYIVIRFAACEEHYILACRLSKALLGFVRKIFVFRLVKFIIIKYVTG